MVEEHKTEDQRTAQEVSGARLKSFIERIERLTEEQKAAMEDIKDVYAEAKSGGFDSKIIRKIVSLRKKNLDKGFLLLGKFWLPIITLWLIS